jgi:hypothetical protein
MRYTTLFAHPRRRLAATTLVATCVLALIATLVGPDSLIEAAVDNGATNLLTTEQQIFEPGTAGWSAVSPATVGTTTTAYAGSRSMAVTSARWSRLGRPKTAGATTLTGSNGVPVTPGATYTGSIRVRAATNPRSAHCELRWYKADGSALSTSTGAKVASTTSGWTKATCAAAAPAGTATVALRVVFSRVGSQERHYADEAWLTTTAAPSTNTFALRINAASSSDLVTPAGTKFVADRDYLGGQGSGDIGPDIGGTDADSLYAKHRWGMRGYAVSVPMAGTYTVRLHFAETVFTASGQRVFDVTAEGATKVAKLDVVATAGHDQALVKQFDVAVADGTLDLGFTAVTEDPMVSGIEVLGAGVATGPAAAPTTTAPPTTAAPTTTTVAPTTTTVAPTTMTVAPAPPAPSTGFPDASNTGPSGALSPSGSISTSANGQVIQNLDITGTISVNHSNVVIRNIRIRQPGGEAISIDPSTSGTVVEDCELDGTGDTRSDPAIAYARYTIRRCDIHHFGEGPRANGDTVIEDNYIHDFVDYSSIDAHQDGIQVVCNNNIVIRHNTILMNTENANAAIMVGTAQGTVDNVVIRDNLMAGGGYTVYGGSAEGYSPNATRVQITNNRISTQYMPRGGYYGPFTNTYQVTMYGNVWHETGNPI